MKKSFIKLFLLMGMLFVGMNVAYADDSFTFKIGGAENIKPGDIFETAISVSGVSSEYTLTGYTLTVGFDTNKLDLVEGEATMSADNLQVTDAGTVATLKFRAKEATDGTKLELKCDKVYNNGEEDKDAKCNSSTVSIRPLSNDTTLKSLKIPNTVLSPEFNKNTTDYTATVTDVTSVDIEAKPSNQYSSVWITENAKNLVKGVNDVTIVVKDEYGNEKWYGIKITLNTTPTEEELKAQDATLKTLTIKGQKIEFNSTEKKYYINVDYETTKLNITATPNNEEAEVKIVGNSKFVVGKNTVKINVTSKDKTKTETYQVIVTREKEEQEVVKTCPEETSKKEWIIFTVSLILTFTLGIVLGYFLCRKEVLNKLFKRKKKEETPVEIETLSDTIDLSDTVNKLEKEKKQD